MVKKKSKKQLMRYVWLGSDIIVGEKKQDSKKFEWLIQGDKATLIKKT